MKENTTRGKTDTLMILLLFSIFALCILSVLLTSTDAYRRLARRDAASYDGRTAEQYLATRLRQGDVSGGVRLEAFGGADALVFTEVIEGELYETRIYCAAGYLRELFTAAGGGFAPEDGEEILPARRLELSLDGQNLTAVLVDGEGAQHELLLYLRSGGGVAAE